MHPGIDGIRQQRGRLLESQARPPGLPFAGVWRTSAAVNSRSLRAPIAVSIGAGMLWS